MIVYPYKPISSLKSLSIVLCISEQELHYIYMNSDSYYFLTKDIIKNDGSHRLTYDVKSKLKTIHDKITKLILKKVNYPDYLQGSLSGKDFISNAKNHSKKRIIISEDITNFFPSISKEIIYQTFSKLFNFSPIVCDILSKLVTYKGYLVQGCKTSSYLCNLVLWNREKALVDNFKKKGFTYTRYVDDIHISSNSFINNDEKEYIIKKVYNLMRSINVKPNRKKHKIMTNDNSQSVHGVIVNKKAAFSKEYRNEIRGLVFNCQKKFKLSIDEKEYTKFYQSVLGKVNLLKRLNENEAKKHLNTLSKIKPIHFKEKEKND